MNTFYDILMQQDAVVQDLQLQALSRIAEQLERLNATMEDLRAIALYDAAVLTDIAGYLVLMRDGQLRMEDSLSTIGSFF